MRLFVAGLVTWGAVLFAATFAQTRPSASVFPPGVGGAIGILHAIHTVGDLEKANAFYRDVFGLSAEARRLDNPMVPTLTNLPGVQLDMVVLRMPFAGFNFALNRFSRVESTRHQARITDPGAAHLRLFVRDIQPIVAAVKRSGVPILSTGGAPVIVRTPSGDVRSLMFRDPDGYMLEAIQSPSAANSSADGNLLDAVLGMTVADLKSTWEFWHGLLGIDLSGNQEFSKDQALFDSIGVAAGAEFRTVGGVIPATRARIEFTEFKGVPGTVFDARLPDVGMAGVVLRVADIRGLLTRMKAAGVRLVSKDGELVQYSPTVLDIFVRDPDGLYVELAGTTP